MATVSRSVKSERFGRPVSESWVAWYRNRASLSRSACSAWMRATIAARRIDSCSSRVRLRSARA